MWYAARRFVAQSRANQVVCWRAFVSLAFLPAILQLIGFQRVMRSIKPTTMILKNDPDPRDWARARQYVYWIDVVARYHFTRPCCLHRSLLLHQWLRGEGLPSELRIGVRTEDGQLRAHAWVELAGDVLNDRPDVGNSFTVLTAPLPLRASYSSAGSS